MLEVIASTTVKFIILESYMKTQLSGYLQHHIDIKLSKHIKYRLITILSQSCEVKMEAWIPLIQKLYSEFI